MSFAVMVAYRVAEVHMHMHGRASLLITAAAGAVVYGILDLEVRAILAARVVHAPRAFVESVRAGIPVVVVLSSSAALVVLVLPLLGWWTFLVMFIPVLATRQEFGRYRKARQTYDETVRALTSLLEGSGYVATGHSERVASLCVQIGRQLALAPDRLHELELVGLLHEAGAVSLADPSDLADVTPEEVARSTGYLLQETEYLARYAAIVVGIARGDRDQPIEGRILRIANAYESAEGAPWARLRSVTVLAQPDDAEVMAALGRVVRVS
jgi:hypothetical protein